MNCKIHQKSLVYLSHLAAFNFFLLKGEVKRGGHGIMTPSTNTPLIFIES